MTSAAARAKIPEDVRHRPKWQLALDILDELIGVGPGAPGGAGRRRLRRHHRLPPGPGGARAPLRRAGQGRDLRSARPTRRPSTPDYQGRGRPPAARYPDKPINLTRPGAGRRPESARRGVLARGRPRPAHQPASSRCASGPPTTPSATTTACCASAGCWPSGRAARTSRSSTGCRTCPPTHRCSRLVALAKLRWRVEHDYRELKQCLGLDHYEGRSYRGLHHHLTCVTVAHAFLTSCASAAATPTAPALRRRQPDQPLPSPARPADRAGLLARPLPDLPAQAAAMRPNEVLRDARAQRVFAPWGEHPQGASPAGRAFPRRSSTGRTVRWSLRQAPRRSVGSR